MYLEYFKLKEEPFSTTTNPKYLYRSQTHQQALERIVMSVSQRRGINAIVAEPGLGKSMLIRTLIQGLNQTVRFAWVFNTTMDEKELLKYICRDFGLQPQGNDVSELIMELYTFLIKEYEQGNYAILIIDEAQSLKINVLEEIRQLSNLETVNKKLLQVILSGQPQLNDYLNHPSLQQLKQRINLKATISRMGKHDTKNYIRHRMEIAGALRNDIFTEAALDEVYEISDGIPRLINQICDNALMEAAKAKRNQIDSTLIRTLLQQDKVMVAPKTPCVERPVKPSLDYNRLVKKNSGKVKSAKNGHSKTGKKVLEGASINFDGIDLSVLAIN